MIRRFPKLVSVILFVSFLSTSRSAFAPQSGKELHRAVAAFTNCAKNAPSPLVLVTGGNKGIGYSIVKLLFNRGLESMQCIFTSRTRANGQKAIESLMKEGVDKNRLHFHELDVSRQESIDTFSKWIADTHPKIDVIVNNAGFAFKGADPTPFNEQAAPTFAVNFFGTVALTEKLRPFLAPKGRIVNVASQSGTSAISRLHNAETKQCLSQPENLESLKSCAQDFVDLVKQKGESCADLGFPVQCYGMSKAFLISYTRLLARAGVNAFACCPGYCKTDMTSHKGGRPADVGAETPLGLALDPLAKTPGGMYYNLQEISTGLD